MKFVSGRRAASVAAERDFDVVVFGATGVTGRRVSAYLAEQGARWAPVARDPGKLERILAEDGVVAPESVIAEVGDADSLAAMASRARVVLNLCGPYTLHGQPVIEACVSNGAHYVDLTGEIPFVRQMIDAYDARARVEGVKVVQVCGFEALPPDLMVLLAAETARERWDEGLAEADLEVSVEGPPWHAPALGHDLGRDLPEPCRGGGRRRCLRGHRPRRADHRSGTCGRGPPPEPDQRRTAARRGRRDRADGAGGVHQPGRDPVHRLTRGRGAVPIPRGARAAGSGGHASASLRGRRRAVGNAGRGGSGSARSAFGAAAGRAAP